MIFSSGVGLCFGILFVIFVMFGPVIYVAYKEGCFNWIPDKIFYSALKKYKKGIVFLY